MDLYHPAKDRKLFGDRFARAIAKVVSACGTVADPETYGRAVADKLLPNVLPYTVGTQAIFGYGLWNGRLLTDSAPDVMFPWPPTRPCPPWSPRSRCRSSWPAPSLRPGDRLRTSRPARAR